MALVSNGQYKVFNVKFPTQDIDLLDGVPTGTIGGYVSNSDSYNMVWNFTNFGDSMNQFTMINAAPSANGAYASIQEATIGAGIRGSSNAAVWTIIPTPQAGQYWILASAAVNSSVPSGLALSLESAVNLFPIKLAPIASNDTSQVWTFSTQGLNDLD